MSASQKLNKLIELYINDAQDYHEDSSLIEETLGPISKLMQEENSSPETVLREALSNATPEQKEILQDFMLYVKHM